MCLFLLTLSQFFWNLAENLNDCRNFVFKFTQMYGFYNSIYRRQTNNQKKKQNQA